MRVPADVDVLARKAYRLNKATPSDRTLSLPRTTQTANLCKAGLVGIYRTVADGQVQINGADIDNCPENAEHGQSPLKLELTAHV
jgi:hypothetical protein